MTIRCWSGRSSELGAEVKQVAAELAEAHKLAKATEHADRRDYAEQLYDVLQQLGSHDLKNVKSRERSYRRRTAP